MRCRRLLAGAARNQAPRSPAVLVTTHQQRVAVVKPAVGALLGQLCAGAHRRHGLGGVGSLRRHWLSQGRCGLQAAAFAGAHAHAAPMRANATPTQPPCSPHASPCAPMRAHASLCMTTHAHASPWPHLWVAVCKGLQLRRLLAQQRLQPRRLRRQRHAVLLRVCNVGVGA